jgi:hypothetical protein
MSVLVDEDVVGLDIAMNVSELVHSFNSENAFGQVETRNVLREDIVFHEHRHQVAAREEFHD